jgi:hypothetical protein
MKYALARVGLFVVVAVPLMLFLPREMNTLLKLMIAIVISAALSYFLLGGLRDQVADQMSENARRKLAEKEKLRAALAGDDEPTDATPAATEPAATEPPATAPTATEPTSSAGH